MPSPVVELNRAVAVGMASGPAAGLAIVDALLSEPALSNYHLLPSVRADLLSKLGRREEARAEFDARGVLDAERARARLLLERARVKSSSERSEGSAFTDERQILRFAGSRRAFPNQFLCYYC